MLYVTLRNIPFVHINNGFTCIIMIHVAGYSSALIITQFIIERTCVYTLRQGKRNPLSELIICMA